jgi:hypothetical protein
MASAMRVSFTASEYQADGSIHPAAYGFTGSPDDGFGRDQEPLTSTSTTHDSRPAGVAQLRPG